MFHSITANQRQYIWLTGNLGLVLTKVTCPVKCQYIPVVERSSEIYNLGIRFDKHLNILQLLHICERLVQRKVWFSVPLGFGYSGPKGVPEVAHIAIVRPLKPKEKKGEFILKKSQQYLCLGMLECQMKMTDRARLVQDPTFPTNKCQNGDVIPNWH